MSRASRRIKVLLLLVAILVSVIFGMSAGILAVASGLTLTAAVGVGGGAFLTTVPVALRIQKATFD